MKSGLVLCLFTIVALVAWQLKPTNAGKINPITLKYLGAAGWEIRWKISYFQS